MTDKTTETASVSAEAFAAVLEALPARLRKRLDASLERAATWPREAAEGGAGLLIRVDDETTVTLRLTAGVVLAADDIGCNCLLAPACLHRAAIAASLPVHDDASAAIATQTTATPGSEAAEAASPPDEPAVADATKQPTAAPAAAKAKTERPASGGGPLTGRERAAASALWESGTAVLGAGVVGAGLFTEAELARATHQARALGLHRASAAGARVTAGLRAARERSDEHYLPRFVADLRELLFVSHQLSNTTDDAVLDEMRGIGRRSYAGNGSMRLHGLFAEPIVARSGHAGVVGYAVDADGVIWSSASIAPGGPELVRPSYDSALKLGGTTLTQREFCRAGLLVSGASSSPDRRLSSTSGTKAVRVEGTAWTEQPVAALFEAPLAAQFRRALRAEPEGEEFSAGDDLVFLRVRVLGTDSSGLIVAVLDADASGVIRCVAPARSVTSPAYAYNISRLAETGAELLLIARPDKASPGSVHALAATFCDEQAAHGIELPEAWKGRLNLALDRIPKPKEDDEAEPAPEGEAAQPEPDAEKPRPSAPIATDSTSLHLLRHHVEQAVAAGRAITRTALVDRDCARLDADAMHTAAALLRGMSAQAEPVRDAFARPTHTDERPKDGYALAWLAAAVYAQAAGVDLAISRWLRALS